MATRPTFRLSKDNRLKDAASFNHVFSRAKRSRDDQFTVLCRSNDLQRARLGLAISKKHCKKAVGRNRIKRIIRESFRQHQAALRGLDIVVMNKVAATDAANGELVKSLEAHWHRCEQREHGGK